jgi:hypothetical protein
MRAAVFLTRSLRDSEFMFQVSGHSCAATVNKRKNFQRDGLELTRSFDTCGTLLAFDRMPGVRNLSMSTDDMCLYGRGYKGTCDLQLLSPSEDNGDRQRLLSAYATPMLLRP